MHGTPNFNRIQNCASHQKRSSSYANNFSRLFQILKDIVGIFGYRIMVIAITEPLINTRCTLNTVKINVIIVYTLLCSLEPPLPPPCGGSKWTYGRGPIIRAFVTPWFTPFLVAPMAMFVILLCSGSINPSVGTEPCIKMSSGYSSRCWFFLHTRHPLSVYQTRVSCSRLFARPVHCCWKCPDTSTRIEFLMHRATALHSRSAPTR